jgi:hypothetical protein
LNELAQGLAVDNIAPTIVAETDLAFMNQTHLKRLVGANGAQEVSGFARRLNAVFRLFNRSREFVGLARITVVVIHVMDLGHLVRAGLAFHGLDPLLPKLSGKESLGQKSRGGKRIRQISSRWR